MISHAKNRSHVITVRPVMSPPQSTTEISGNHGNGVDISQNATADFGSGVNIHDNDANGINLFNGGHLNMTNVTVQNNQGGALQA